MDKPRIESAVRSLRGKKMWCVVIGDRTIDTCMAEKTARRSLRIATVGWDAGYAVGMTAGREEAAKVGEQLAYEAESRGYDNRFVVRCVRAIRALAPAAPGEPAGEKGGDSCSG